MVQRPPSAVVDEETGIIRWMAELPVEPGEPLIFNYSAKMADTGVYLPLGCYDSNGGAGLTRTQAYAAAVGEALERYCCSVYFTDQLVLGTAREVSSTSRALQPGELALFHPRQQQHVRYAPFTADTPVCWTSGWSISRREPILVPSCMVYIPYYPYFRERGELTIGPSISTGQACARGYEDALLRGLYEVLERDAFTITWLNRLPVPRIRLEPTGRVARAFRERFARPHLEYSLFRMATDIDVACVLCILVDRRRNPPLICSGGAANLDPEQAALKALLEAAQTYQWARYLGQRPEPVVIEPDYTNIDDFEKHVFLYAYGDMEHAARFLLDTTDEVDLMSLASAEDNHASSELARVLARVEARNLEVLGVDLTVADVESCGYRVVKVLVPGAQQLHGDHSHRFLGGERLYRVPVELGFPGPRSFETLNPDPHPYP